MVSRLELFEKIDRNSIHFIPIIPTLLLFFCLITACVHAPAPYRPTHWVNTPIDLKSIADDPNQPLLQVIIVYGPG